MTQSNALVTLTRAQADALEAATGIYCDHDIIAMHVENPEGWSDGIYAPLNGLPLRTVALALYAGYDVEETPEERIRAYYKSAIMKIGANAPHHNAFAEAYAEGQMHAVHFVLKALGREIDDIPLGYKTEVSE
jgi:hypothetical protein